jgi:hypothetical protein
VTAGTGITVTNGDGVSGNPTVAATLASQAEAEAGTDNTKLITPLRLRNALNATGSATIYACRAWVNFNGTGTVAIRGSGNVSSITDNGTGDYTVNFTTAMPDANYSSVCSAATTVSTDGRHISPRDFATNSVGVTVRNGGGTASLDTEINCVAIFR